MKKKIVLYPAFLCSCYPLAILCLKHSLSQESVSIKMPSLRTFLKHHLQIQEVFSDVLFSLHFPNQPCALSIDPPEHFVVYLWHLISSAADGGVCFCRCYCYKQSLSTILKGCRLHFLSPCVCQYNAIHIISVQ